MINIFTDEYFMKEAIKEAHKALEEGEIPVGAVVVANQKIISKAHNQTQLLNDVTAHAEIVAITAASSALGAKYLNDCTIYITLEPCLMCAGALMWSQIGKVVYGASDDKRGFMKYGKEVLHPSTKLEFGMMHNECASLLTDFFKKKRTSVQKL
jgi:tRNA(adenine34) deaminase